MTVRLAHNDYEHVELEAEEIGTRFTNDATEARVEILHAPLGRWSGAVGVQLGDREFAAIGEEAFVPPVDTRSYGVFLVEQLDLSPWQLSFGGRFETQEHVPAGAAMPVDGNASSLSLAGVRTLSSGYSVAVNVALAERLPEAEELYSDGPHLATGVVQLGDSTLTEEASTHLDVGLRRTDGDLTWSVTAFRTRYADFIYLDDTGGVDVDADLPIFAFTRQDADFVGVEAEVFTPIATLGRGEVDMRLFADYVRGELRSGAICLVCPHRDSVRASSITTSACSQASRPLVTTSRRRSRHTRRLPTAYTMLNADFRWQVNTATGMQLELFVNASNLGDEEARKHTSFVKEIAPLPGRNFALGVRSHF